MNDDQGSNYWIGLTQEASQGKWNWIWTQNEKRLNSNNKDTITKNNSIWEGAVPVDNQTAKCVFVKRVGVNVDLKFISSDCTTTKASAICTKFTKIKYAQSPLPLTQTAAQVKC